MELGQSGVQRAGMKRQGSWSNASRAWTVAESQAFAEAGWCNPHREWGATAAEVVAMLETA